MPAVAEIRPCQPLCVPAEVMFERAAEVVDVTGRLGMMGDRVGVLALISYLSLMASSAADYCGTFVTNEGMMPG